MHKPWVIFMSERSQKKMGTNNVFNLQKILDNTNYCITTEPSAWNRQTVAGYRKGTKISFGMLDMFTALTLVITTQQYT